VDQKSHRREHKKLCPSAWRQAPERKTFLVFPAWDEIQLSADASYVYMCVPTTTIFGPSSNSFPTGSVPLVAISRGYSVAAARCLEIRFDLRGAQKNIGPSEVTVVIVRKDLGRTRADDPFPP
jgi:phosphoserine aminotransferase